MLFGIDASHYQEVIDWKKVKAAGISFAIIKATEGISVIDARFIDNFHGAQDAGIIPGTYHFHLPKYSPLAQAEFHLNVMAKVQGPKLPLCIDLETPGANKSKMNSDLQIYLAEIEKRTKRKGMIYTSPGFWQSYFPYPFAFTKIQMLPLEWAAAYPLWVAHYTTGWPLKIYPWAGWTFWQYSSAGMIPGINTKVDLNLFNGTIEQLTGLAQ